jgi:hypothetical protein
MTQFLAGGIRLCQALIFQPLNFAINWWNCFISKELKNAKISLNARTDKHEINLIRLYMYTLCI